MSAVTASLGRAGAADFGAVQGLLAQAGLPTSDLSPADMAGFTVARAGGRIVGAVGLEVHDEDGLLRSLVVDPAWRDRGLGRALIEAAEQRARGLSLRSLWLLTSGAAEFFRRHGYATAVRRQASAGMQACSEFAALCPDSAACLRKALH